MLKVIPSALYLQAALLAFLLALSGCNCGGDTGFCWTCGDDDDNGGVDDDDDDDDDTPSPGTPRIELVTVEPDEEPVSGVVAFSYRVNDSDSDGYTVIAEFGTTGESSAFQPAALVDEFGLPLNSNEVVFAAIEGAPPVVDHEGTIKWNSTANIVETDAGIFRICVEDPEGNVSDPCATWPEEGGIEVKNEDLEDLGSFCQPGDINEVIWVSGRAVVPLSNTEVTPPCLNYQGNSPPQPTDFSSQFLMVFVNPDPDPVGFSIRTTDGPADLGEGGGEQLWRQPVVAQRPDISEARFQSAAPRGSASRSAGREICNADALVAADVHNDPREVYLRDTLEDGADRSPVPVRLRALGENIAIYVDETTPMAVDLDCDNVAPDNYNNTTGQGAPDGIPDDIDMTGLYPWSNFEAAGFDNCDLEQVVGIVETNIYPQLTAKFGLPPDVDGNCRVTVFISHRVNLLTEAGEAGAENKPLVKSFTEPEIDLWAEHTSLNPDSNQQEVIFLYAPNPIGYFAGPLVALDSYLNYEVAGRISVALQELISYNAHRDVGMDMLDPSSPDDLGRPPAEEDWLLDAMSLLAADLTGFGAISYSDAWVYQDASYLLPLISNNTLQDLGNRGAQYLFARYLHDLYGDDVIWQIVNSVDAEGEPLLDDGGSPTRGVDTIAALTDVDEFAEFALQWGTAMAVSGMTNEVGGQLVFDTDIPNYETSSTAVVSDPANPAPGELWGANGFQLGYNVRGFNRTYSGGTDPAGPAEESSRLTRTENLDYMLFHPQQDFFGNVAGNFGVLTVLVSGLEQAENFLLIQTATGSDLMANVIRISDADPANPRLTLENVDGAKLTAVRQLGVLDPQGLQRHVIGLIDAAESFDVIEPISPPAGDDDDSAGMAARDPDGDDDDSALVEVSTEIADTDRFGFTLSATTNLAIWVDRRLSSIEGEASFADPFLAVALESDVPDAADYSMWGFGPNPTNGQCANPEVYFYPQIMPSWVAAQGNLINNPIYGAYVAAAGTMGNSTFQCIYDHDQDGIPDADEKTPESLSSQIRQRQAENLAISPNFYLNNFGSMIGGPDTSAPFFDASFIDVDSNETPQDDDPTAYRDLNIGGRAIEDGEEAIWKGTLPPGDYIVIVGGVGDIGGPYDLSIKVLTN